MLISGDYIALSVSDDFKVFEDLETPMVIWINLKSISSLACYLDRYELRLINNTEPTYILTSSAANKIIELLRKDRDDKFRSFFKDLTKEQRNKLKENVKKKEEKNDN